MMRDSVTPRADRNVRPSRRIDRLRHIAFGGLALLCALGFTARMDRAAAEANPNALGALTPTLKAEIQRGYTVANFCFNRKKAHNNAFDDCLGMFIRGQSHNPLSHYFMLGLEFGCWRTADRVNSRYAALYYFELKSYQKHLGVTDDQMVKATSTRDTKARARLTYWAKNRPTPTVAIRPNHPNPKQALR